MYVDPESIEGVRNYLYELVEEEDKQSEKGYRFQPHFLFGRNLGLTVGWLIVGLIATIWLLTNRFPEQIAVTNLQFDFAWFISYVLCYILIGGPGEWAFHKYVLHEPNPIVRPLKRAYESHHIEHHKKLTPVQITQNSGIVSRYPITEASQVESATFPWYTIGLMWLFLLVVMALLQLLFPSIPIYLPIVLAMVTAVFFYENKHAIDHFPEVKWRKYCRLPIIGKLLLAVHRHHLLHHWKPNVNLNVVGVLLVPLGDYLSGTYVRSKTFDRVWLEGNLNPGEEIMKQILAELREKHGIKWSQKKSETNPA